jgi:hypothetical protein
VLHVSLLLFEAPLNRATSLLQPRRLTLLVALELLATSRFTTSEIADEEKGGVPAKGEVALPALPE